MGLFILQTLVAAVAAGALLVAYRWMRIRVPLAATLYALGLLARMAIGVGLAASWIGTAAPGAQLSPDTRWFPDAQLYFDVATLAATDGLAVIHDGDASPTFVRGLALWMRAAGSSHGTAHLFNLLVYMAICVGVVWAFSRRNDRGSRAAAALVVGAFALSPNLIILASQPLKDPLFFAALALVVFALHAMLERTAGQTLRVGIVPLLLVLFGMYVLAGMRVYYGLLILGLLGVVLAGNGLVAAMETRRPPGRFAAGAFALLAVAWIGCWVGGGPYYETLARPVLAPVTERIGVVVEAAQSALWPGPIDPAPKAPVDDGPGLLGVVQQSRRGFEATPGATNMTGPELDRSTRTGVLGLISGVGLGLAAVFVPVTLLRWSGLIAFPGGGTLLYLTDVDTLFIDLTIAACVVHVWRNRRQAQPHVAFALFVLALGVTSALLVGYVVTNYGTLFRLRLMAAVPLWLLPLALTDARVWPGNASRS